MTFSDDIRNATLVGETFTIPELIDKIMPDVPSYERTNRVSNAYDVLMKGVKWGIYERIGYTDKHRALWRRIA